MRQFLSLVACAFVIAGCSSKKGRNEHRQQAPDRRADAIEAVFRHLFEHNGSAVQKKAPAYFLTIDGKNPSGAFLARFKRHTPPVGPGSRFAPVFNKVPKLATVLRRGDSSEKQKLQPEYPYGKGLLFRVAKVRMADEDNFEMTGGYYEGNMSSSSRQHRAKWIDGRWKVEPFGILTISRATVPPRVSPHLRERQG
jgi:hypothetical protein